MQFPRDAYGLDSDHLCNYRAYEPGFDTSGDGVEYMIKWHIWRFLSWFTAVRCTGQVGLLFME